MDMNTILTPTQPSNSNSQAPPPRPQQKVARNRVIQACLPCHHGKRKCNRKKPCSQCLRRHATANCVYESVPASDLEDMQGEDNSLEIENRTLRSRVADLEAAIADYKAQLRATSGAHKRSRARPEGNPEGSRAQPPEPEQHGVYYGDSMYLGSSAAPDLLQRVSSIVPQDKGDLIGAFAGSSGDPMGPTLYIFPTLFSATQGVKELIAILHHLGRQHCDKLLEAYYEVVDPIHHYVPRAWIVQRYERCWDTSNSSYLAQEAALVFATLALGDAVTTNSHAVLLIATSMQLLRTSNFLAVPTLDCIAAFCLIAVYLQHQGKLNEYWPVLGLVIRLAQSLALHRDPSAVLSVRDDEAELRRRLFWALATQETIVSSVFGRPYGVQFADCKLPRDISDRELFEENTGEYPSEGSGANEVSYNRLFWDLGRISRDIVQNASHNVSDPHMADRQLFEQRIEQWLERLPRHFQYDPTSDTPESFPDKKSREKFIHSIILHVVAKFNIVVLYRKALLSGKPSDHGWKACYEAAFEVADGWKLLQDRFPKEARITWMHWFRAFHAALICFVVLRAEGLDSRVRWNAMGSWTKCLEVFSSIKDQNSSTLSCWRALKRLDDAMRRGCPKESRRQTQILNGSSREGSESSSSMNPSAKDDQPLVHTSIGHVLDGTVAGADRQLAKRQKRDTQVPEDAKAPKGSKKSFHFDGDVDDLEYSLPRFDSLWNVNLGFGPLPDASTPGFEMQGFDIFDMNTEHWPSWLTDDNSPVQSDASVVESTKAEGSQA